MEIMAQFFRTKEEAVAFMRLIRGGELIGPKHAYLYDILANIARLLYGEEVDTKETPWCVKWYHNTTYFMAEE